MLISHLHSIRQAVHDRKSKYAIILEDDFVLPFHFNMSRFIEMAPKNFATIQLVTSDSGQLLFNMERSIEGRISFRPREMHTWCLGAYLIDTERFQPFIDSVLTTRPHQSQLVLNLFILHHCNPRGRFVFPTTCSPYSFAADFTLYHVFQNDTYISTFPFAESINHLLQNTSSSVMIHNKKHGNENNLRTLKLNNAFVDKMKSGEVKVPDFAYQRRVDS